MAIFSLKSKEILGNLTAPANIDLGAMIPIATTTVGTSGSSITFSSIPQNYEHLQIRVYGRSVAAAVVQNLAIQAINGSSTADLTGHYLSANGTSTYSGFISPAAIYVTVGKISGSGSTANAFSPAIIDILDYTNTNKYKTIRTISSADNNGAGEVFFSSSLWYNTAAITQFLIMPDSGFISGSQVALYGIKKAGS